MIKVLQVGLSDNIGGLETMVRSWWSVLKDTNEVTFDFLCATDHKLAFYKEYEKEGCVIHQITPRKRDFFKSYSDLKRIMRQNDYDIVHFHIMSYAWVEPIIIASRYSNAQIIVHSHVVNSFNSLCKKDYVLDKIGRLLIRNIKFNCFACGREAGKSMFKSNFTVIENGVDEKKFSFNKEYRNQIRKKYSITDNEIIIGHVGNFSVNKNYPFIIDTFYELQKINPSIKLMLIGNDKIHMDTHNRVDKLCLNENVIFTGLVSNSNEYYSAMDLFFFPSIKEGLPVCLIEAQVSGLPCLVSNMVTKECDVSNNYYVFSIDNKPSDVANIILKMIDKKKDRNSIIKAEYDIKNSAHKLLNYYKRILKQL